MSDNITAYLVFALSLSVFNQINNLQPIFAQNYPSYRFLIYDLVQIQSFLTCEYNILKNKKYIL